MLAYLDADSNLRLRDEDGAERSLTAAWMMADPAAPDAESVWRWPTWRPDGKGLAIVGLLVEDRRVLSEMVWFLPVHDKTGRGLADLPESSLIYLAWGPSGGQLALLLQDEEGIFLELLPDVERDLRRQSISRGGPLFLAQNRDELVTHVRAETEHGRLWIRSRGESWDEPGWFRTPWLPDAGGVVCTRREKTSGHALGVLRDGRFDAIAPLQGRIAIVPLSAQQALVAEAAGLESPGYVAIHLLDLPSGRLERVVDTDCLALFPAGPRRAVCVSGSPKSGLLLSTLDLDGKLDLPLGGFALSPADLLRLGFFDQYAASHPVVSADGRHLAVSGCPVGRPREEAGVYLIATDGSAAPELVGAGSFATFSPLVVA